MKYSLAIPEDIHKKLARHLIRADKQEDLCFAFYNLSSGRERFSGVIREVLFPVEGDRNVHGNVSFNPEYWDKVTAFALANNYGICFMHSHPAPGWQSMSTDDKIAELMLSPRAKATTALPLIGMTIGNDETWSARFWIKSGPKKYKLRWCDSVRVVGKKLQISWNENQKMTAALGVEFTRTVSAWGEEKQKSLSRLKVGIIGLGSVGSIIAETLMRTGIVELSLIDFDITETKNLDRQLAFTRKDVGRFKIEAIKARLSKTRLHSNLKIKLFPFSISEEEAIKAALDCDILFSCVDRPLPRFILDKIAYANLIPVVDGGIDASPNKKFTNLDQARWKAHTAGPGRRCMKCLEQYYVEDVALELSGMLEDPTYIKGLPKEHFINRGENVFAFSLGVAGMEIQQFLSLILQPRGQFYGPKEFDFNTGNIDFDFEFHCNCNCENIRDLAMGDKVNQTLISPCESAIHARASASSNFRGIIERFKNRIFSMITQVKSRPKSLFEN